MTVATTDNKVLYTADGIEVEFTFAFHTQNDTDIDVYVDDIIDGSVTVLLNADQETAAGGKITFSTAPADEVIVSIVRTMNFDQQTDYPVSGNFPSESHENALDKLTMLAQQINSANAGTLKFPVSENTDGELPIASLREGLFLSFDANGDILMVSSTVIDPSAMQKPLTGPEDNLVSFSSAKDGKNSGITANSVFITFDNIASMKTKSLSTGITIATRGHSVAGDGGGAIYLVVAPQISGGHGDHELANGNVAVLQYENDINAKVFGLHPDNLAAANDAAFIGMQIYLIAKATALSFAPAVWFPEGRYTFSTGRTTYTWQRFVGQGLVEWYTPNLASAATIITNNASVGQGLESHRNSGPAISGILHVGNGTVGSIGVKIGGGVTSYYSAFSGIDNCRIAYFESGLQLVPIQTFALRFTGVKINNCTDAINFSADAKSNSGELTSFIDCFINNNDTAINMNVEGFMFSFLNSSISFNKTPIKLNGDRNQLFFNSCWFEKWSETLGSDWLVKAFVSAVNGTINISNSHLYFKTYHDATGEEMYRHLFEGTMKVIMNGNDLYSTKVNVEPAEQFLADDDVIFYGSNNSFQNDNLQVACLSTRFILNTNPYIITNINGYTGPGSDLTYSTTKSYTSPGSAKLSDLGSPGYREVTLDDIYVKAGGFYYVSYLANQGDMTAGRTGHYFKYYDKAGVLLLTGASRTSDKLDPYLSVDVWKKAADAMDYAEYAPAGTAYVVPIITVSATFAGDVYFDNIIVFEIGG